MPLVRGRHTARLLGAVGFLLIATMIAGCSGEPHKVVNVTQYNGGKGAPLYVSGDAARLTGAPKDFQEFMAARVRSAIEFDDGQCSEPPVYSVKAVADSGHASGSLSQCGLRQIIWARSGGKWKQIWSGDTEPDCATLKKYTVPSGIAGKSCRDSEGSHLYRD